MYKTLIKLILIELLILIISIKMILKQK